MILLVSVSARMLAELAARDGHDVIARRPLRRPRPAARCARACRSCATSAGGRDGGARRRGRADPRPTRVVYGAGLENRPDLVGPARRRAHAARLHRRRRCGACAIRRCSARRCAPPGSRTRARSPPREAPARADRARRWLRKPVRGGGGRGVREWRGGRLRAGVVVQERIAGLPCSAAAVADGRSAALLGVSEQLIGRRALGARGFTVVRERRAAAAARSASARALGDAARAICAHLAAAFGLRGLFGVDLVWDGERAWVVEVNPRPTASLETIEAVARRARRSRRTSRRAPGACRPTALRRRAGRAPPARRSSSRRADAAGPRHARLAGARHPRRAPPRRGDRGRPSDLHARRDRPVAGGRARRARGARRRAARRAPRPAASMPSPDAAGAPARATCAGCGLVCDDIDGRRRRRTARSSASIRTCPLGDAWFADRVAPAAPLARRRRARGGARRGARRGGGDPRRGRARRSSTGWARRRARRSARRSRWPRRSAR